MTTRSRLRPHFIGVLLLASLAAAAPVVRRCPFDWSDVDLRTYAACAAMPKAGDCRANVAACSETESCPLHAGAMASNPVHARATESCPLEAGAAESCPMQAANAGEPDVGSQRHVAANPAAPARGKAHAYCLDEPFMATASRAHPPAPPAPLAIAAAIVTIEVPATVRPTAFTVEARPPTGPYVARPPIRGPPPLLG